MNKLQCEQIAEFIATSENKPAIESRLETLKEYDACDAYLAHACDNCNACEILEVLNDPDAYLI